MVRFTSNQYVIFHVWVASGISKVTSNEENMSSSLHTYSMASDHRRLAFLKLWTEFSAPDFAALNFAKTMIFLTNEDVLVTSYMFRVKTKEQIVVRHRRPTFTFSVLPTVCPVDFSHLWIATSSCTSVAGMALNEFSLLLSLLTMINIEDTCFKFTCGGNIREILAVGIYLRSSKLQVSEFLSEWLLDFFSIQKITTQDGVALWYPLCSTKTTGICHYLKHQP